MCAGALFTLLSSFSWADDVPSPARQESVEGIRHSFLLCGSRMTAIFDEDSQVVWSVPGGSRDGMVLPNGNILICRSKEVVEYRAGTDTAVWSYTIDPKNKEFGTAWRLEDGNTLVVESGNVPRLMELDAEGKVVLEFPLEPETDNIHMQTRMARKLPNGNYLAPHLLAFKVKEYDPTGKVVREIKTDLAALGGREKRNWPFTAIRLKNGHTVVNLTNGNKAAVFDSEGNVVWVCSNADLPDRFKDPCGGHVLPNGNIVIGNYGQKDPSKARAFELSPDKKVVWEFYHPKAKAHEIHILTTNGKKLNSYEK